MAKVEFDFTEIDRIIKHIDTSIYGRGFSIKSTLTNKYNELKNDGAYYLSEPYSNAESYVSAINDKLYKIINMISGIRGYDNDMANKIADLDLGLQTLIDSKKEFYQSWNVKVSDIISIKNYTIENIKKFDDEDLAGYLNQLTEAERKKAENIEIHNLYINRQIFVILSKEGPLSGYDIFELRKLAAQSENFQENQGYLEYLIANKENIKRDIKLGIIGPITASLGRGFQNYGVFQNSIGAIKGPLNEVGNPGFLIQNPTLKGNKFIKLGKTLIKSGKTLIKSGSMIPNVFTAVGLGLGMYDDLANRDKTIGEAIAHNGTSFIVTTGAIMGATGFVALTVGTFGIGGAVVVGLGTITPVVSGITAGLTFEYSYAINKNGLQDTIDGWGRNIDNGLNYVGEQINEFASYYTDIVLDGFEKKLNINSFFDR